MTPRIRSGAMFSGRGLLALYPFLVAMVELWPAKKISCGLLVYELCES